MAVSFIAASTPYTTGSGTSSSFVIALPTGWAAGDTCVLRVHISATSLTLTVPAGWSAPTGVTNPVNEGVNSRTYVLYRVMQAGDTAPTLTISGAATGGATMTCWRGGDTAAAPRGATATAAASLTTSLPSLTSVPSGAGLDVSAHARVASGTVPTNLAFNVAYTERSDVATSRVTSNANMRMGVATRVTASSGTFGGESVSDASGVSASWVASMVEIVPAPSSVTLTPATASFSAPAVTPVPQPVTTAITPATGTFSAPAVTPAGGPSTVALTPATATFSAPATTPVPQPVTVALSPATATFSAPQVTPGGVTGRTATVAETSSGTSVTGTLPTDRVTGDYVVATFAMTCTVAQFTGPGGGWSTLVAPTAISAGETFAVYGMFNPGAGPVGTSSVAGRHTCVTQAYGGVDTTTPMDVSPITTSGTAKPYPLTGLSTVTADAMLVSVVGADWSVGTWTQPAGMTLEAAHTTNVGRALALAQERRPATGATGARSWTSTAAAGLTFTGTVLALRPATGVAPSSVTLTPATATFSAPAVVPVPQPVTVTLTPATASFSARPVTAAPGPGAVTLVPATAVFSARPVTATPGPVTVPLVPATATFTAPAVVPDSGTVKPLGHMSEVDRQPTRTSGVDRAAATMYPGTTAPPAMAGTDRSAATMEA